jgi:hypothetical protein
MMHAAARGHDDSLETGKEVDEMGLGPARGALDAVIGHGLPAAGLALGVDYFDPQALKQFQARDAHFREEGIDETRDCKPNRHLAGAV